MSVRSGDYESNDTKKQSQSTKLGEAAPKAPFALVALSYLGALAGVCAVAVLVYWVI